MRVKEMLQTHPRQFQGDLEALTQCIEACYECAQTCASCADACLGEAKVASLIRCISLNLNCASICEATGQVLSRQTEAEWAFLLSQLGVCATACQLCGAECQKHAHHHEHCRVCAEACRHCEEACNRLMAAVPAPA
jgi:hypothetical protein